MKTLIKMTFNPSVAKHVGTDAAIILANIEFWVAKNKANGRNLFDDYHWTYNSIKAWQELFPYLSIKQIRTCLTKLEKNNYIMIGEHNKSNYDRTKWYTVLSSDQSEQGMPNSEKSSLPNGKVELPKSANGGDQSGQPIPVSKHILKTKQIKNPTKQTNQTPRDSAIVSARDQGSYKSPGSAKRVETFDKVDKDTIKQVKAALFSNLTRLEKQNGTLREALSAYMSYESEEYEIYMTLKNVCFEEKQQDTFLISKRDEEYIEKLRGYDIPTDDLINKLLNNSLDMRMGMKTVRFGNLFVGLDSMQEAIEMKAS